MIKDSTPISVVAKQLGLTTRMLNILADNNIKTFGEFMNFIPSTKYRNMGTKTAHEIVAIQDLFMSEIESKQSAKEIDWEERRYQIANATMQGILYGFTMTQEDIENACHDVVKSAIMLADALIVELKK